MNRASATSQDRPVQFISRMILLALLASSAYSQAPDPARTQIALSQPLIVKWRYQSDQSSNLSPTADKTTVFLPLGGGTLIALNAADGKLLWRAEAGGELSASPANDDR